MKILLPLIFLSVSAFAEPRTPAGQFYVSSQAGFMGWNAYELCGKENDPKELESYGVYYVQKDADEKCGGVKGSAKLVEGSLQATGICSMPHNMPALFTILAVATFRCVR